MHIVNYGSAYMFIKSYLILALFLPVVLSSHTEKGQFINYNQTYYNHRTGAATKIPWNVLFDPNYSGVAKIDGTALTSTTPSSISVFYGQSIYSAPSHEQSSTKKKKHTYSDAFSPIISASTTKPPHPSSVVVGYSSPVDQPANSEENMYSEVSFPSPKPTYSEQQLDTGDNQAESRVQSPTYSEGSFSRPYYPEYQDDSEKLPTYSEKYHRKKKKHHNDRRPLDYYKKTKPTFNEHIDTSDDIFEPLSIPFEEPFTKRPTPPAYRKKSKERPKRPDLSNYYTNKEDYTTESKHHPFYNYDDYYGDYYENAGHPMHFKHKVYTSKKKSSKYAPLAFALGLLPLGIMLAAIVPSVMTIPATVTTAAVGKKKRSVPETKYENPVLDTIVKYGMKNLEDPMCLQKVFCQVATQGKRDKSNFVQKIFYSLAKVVDEAWVEKYGMKLLLRAIKRDQCDAFPCSPAKDKKKVEKPEA